MPHPSSCFRSCEQCCGWQVKANGRKSSPRQRREDTDGETLGNSGVNHIYNGPVTNNNYYTLPEAPPVATPTSDSSCRDNFPLSTSLQCQTDNVGSHDLKVVGSGSCDFSRKTTTEVCTEEQMSSSCVELSVKSMLSSPTGCLQPLSDNNATTRQRHKQSSSGHHQKEPPKDGKSYRDQRPPLLKDGSKTSGSSQCRQNNELCQLGRRLFDVFPYHFIKRHYHGLKKEVFWSFLVVFFIYQGVSSVLMTICEDGGVRAIFHSEEINHYPEVINRVLKFSLRIIFRVVLPLCCSLQLPVLATTPVIPEANFSKEEATRGLMRIHEQFSSEDEVVFLRNTPNMVISMSEKMAKRRIRSMWITITHSFLQIFLVVYLGAFYACEQNTMSGGVCNFLSVTIIHIPYLGVHFHFMIAMESLTVLINFLIIGVVGDCYNYENRIATYAMIIGGEVRKLFQEIRRRWVVMDRLVCAMSVVMTGILALSISTGRPFLSTPIQAVQDSDLVNWYFWIIVLTVLFFLGNSSNRMVKNACIGGYAIATILVFTVEVETAHIPYGSIMVLVYTLTSAYILNHLYCLGRCYYSNTSCCTDWLPFVSIVFLTFLLCSSLFVIIYREISLFSMFVAW